MKIRLFALPRHRKSLLEVGISIHRLRQSAPEVVAKRKYDEVASCGEKLCVMGEAHIDFV